MKTHQVETPVQMIDGFIPYAEVSRCPGWAFEAASEQHGNGKLIRGTYEDGKFLVCIQAGAGFRCVPPGDWILLYDFDRENGCNSVQLFVAAKVA